MRWRRRTSLLYHARGRPIRISSPTTTMMAMTTPGCMAASGPAHLAHLGFRGAAAKEAVDGKPPGAGQQQREERRKVQQRRLLAGRIHRRVPRVLAMRDERGDAHVDHQ